MICRSREKRLLDSSELTSDSSSGPKASRKLSPLRLRDPPAPEPKVRTVAPVPATDSEPVATEVVSSNTSSDKRDLHTLLVTRQKRMTVE